MRWNELGLLAQRYYAQHQDESWDELRLALREAKGQITDLVSGYSDEELYGWLRQAGFDACETRAAPPPMPHWLVSARKAPHGRQ